MDNSDPLAPAHTGDVDEGEQAEYTHTFVDEDADVILRSSDNIDFRVYKVILSRSSDFFKGMFTLPQSSNQPRAQPPTTPTPLSPPAISRSLSGGTDTGSISEYIDGVPVVPVAEPSQVLDHVLQFLYPMPDPDMSSLDVFCPVLEAATKYDIEHLVEKLRKIWPTLAENDPLRSFALAYKSKWQEETSIAARMALEKPIWPLEPPLPLEFRCISAEIIIYLESYHRKCGDAAFKLTETREWAVGILEAQTCAHCNKRYKTQNQGLQVLDWMTLFLKYAGPAVKVVPSAKTVRNPELLHQSIVNSYQTTRCEIPMHCEDRFKCFVEILANEIDEIVSRNSSESFFAFFAVTAVHVFPLFKFAVIRLDSKYTPSLDSLIAPVALIDDLHLNLEQYHNATTAMPSDSDFEHPFTDEDADLIIRSNDNVDFRVYKVILAKASPLFKDMFTLPSPSPSIRQQYLQDEYQNGVPIITLAEDAPSIDLLLRFCYPIENPSLDTFEDIETVLELGTKYDIEILINASQKALHHLEDASALKVFVLACRFKLPDLAQRAAKLTLNRPILTNSMKPPFPPELHHISAMTFCILVDYHHRCSRVASALASNYTWVEDTGIVVICSNCCAQSRTFRYKSGGRFPAASWYTDYMDRAGAALNDRPCGGTVVDPGLLEPSLQRASQCTLCGPYALVGLHKLSMRFAEEVDNAISKVPLGLEF
ncbi:hypothetical protein NLI96_g4245 [Meripilus lineatus]|uniref:BTB domain-containing protein n=1 Tax=Meripilus lineatus TaxID=2056292 RepID=A0AAD5V580_9APHY|nr:hypothetical protein NLI96_g4245 [Physisporinus lineatus]